MVDSVSAAWQRWWRGRTTSSPVTLAARRQGYVLTVQQCAALGVTDSAVRTAVRNGRWYRAAAGVVAPFDLTEDAESSHEVERRRHAVGTAAAALRRVDHIASARSAAVLHGLPVGRTPAVPELTAPNAGGLGRPHHPDHCYGARLTAASVTAWHGVPVTRVERTLVDLARHDRRDGLMAADAALREGLVDEVELELELADARGWPGVRTARAVMAFADPLAESPLESVVRLALHDSGFPPPRLQARIGFDRVDFHWPEVGVVLEADGRAKYSADALWREKEREQRLRRHGVRVVERIIWSDVFDGWSLVEARLHSHMPRLLHPPG